MMKVWSKKAINNTNIHWTICWIPYVCIYMYICMCVYVYAAKSYLRCCLQLHLIFYVAYYYSQVSDVRSLLKIYHLKIVFIVICSGNSYRFICYWNFSFLGGFFGEGKGGRKRARETSMCGCLLCAPYWELGLQPRHVPWLVIEPVTLWVSGWRSIHWATPARVQF